MFNCLRLSHSNMAMVSIGYGLIADDLVGVNDIVIEPLDTIRDAIERPRGAGQHVCELLAIRLSGAGDNEIYVAAELLKTARNGRPNKTLFVGYFFLEDGRWKHRPKLRNALSGRLHPDTLTALVSKLPGCNDQLSVLKSNGQG